MIQGTARHAMKKRELPAHITIPNWDGYQVRIVREGQEYSASFAWSNGGKRAALAEAVRWRDTMLAALPVAGNVKGQYRDQPLSNKRSWSRVGVTRYVSIDRRRAGRPVYLRFGVNWTDENGRRRVTSFWVGNVETISPADERYAATVAEAFRADWEFCRTTGRPFDPSKYRSWKECAQ